MTVEFALGAKVTFTRELERKTKADWSARTWVPQEEYAKPREGVVVGKRTLNNGIFTSEGLFEAYDEGLGQVRYRTTESFCAYLIAYDLHRKPVHVLPEDISYQADVCPYDCDVCHDSECPCDRAGCAGSEEWMAAL